MLYRANIRYIDFLRVRADGNTWEKSEKVDEKA